MFAFSVYAYVYHTFTKVYTFILQRKFTISLHFQFTLQIYHKFTLSVYSVSLP